MHMHPSYSAYGLLRGIIKKNGSCKDIYQIRRGSAQDVWILRASQVMKWISTVAGPQGLLPTKDQLHIKHCTLHK